MRLRLVSALSGCLLLAGPPAARAQLSEQTRAKINAAFLAYRPNQPEPKPASGTVGEPHAVPGEGDVVRLPRFYVEDSKLGRADSDALLTRKAREQKALRQYRASMNALDWALNSWYIPFVTSPVRARANAAYEQQKSAAEAKRLAELMAAPDR